MTRRCLLLCAVIAAGLHLSLVSAAAAEANTADAQGSQAIGLDPESIDTVAGAFVNMLGNAYDLSNKMLPNDFSLTKAGLSPEVIQAADEVRASLRQSLAEVVDLAVNKTSEFFRTAQEEMQKAGLQGNNTLLQRLSSIPIKFDAQGNTLVSNPLTAMGTFLVNSLQQQLKAVRQQGGQDLDQQLGQSAAGRKLLQEMEAFEADVDIDLTQPSPEHGPVAVARQMNRIMDFLMQLVEVADDVVAEFDEATAAGDKAEQSDDFEDPLAATSRKLQQVALLPDPNAGYAKAVRLIFSNIFDFFRAGGLYGLTPLLADVRGILTRYNWIADLLNIIDAPLENFVNANYFPLPQSNEDFVKLVQKFAADYCKLEKATSSETILGSFEGATVSYELKPVSCPIYTDPSTGRNYVSFADCDPATLVIKTTPLTITEAYFSAAEYTGTECKYSEPFGTDFALTVGGGEQSFTFTRSANGINIIPSVIQLNGRGRFHNSIVDGTPDTDLPGNSAFGNGFFANNWGWSFKGLNPSAPPTTTAGK